MRRFVAFLILFLPIPAFANDSTAALTAGGLVLTKTDDIAMEREALTITPEAITVAYRFRNQSPKPVTTRVAFPLPDLTLSEVFYDHPAFPSEDPVNFVNFQTSVEGRVAPFDASIRFRVEGKDVTEDFLGLGVVRSLADAKLHQKIDNQEVQARLKGIGVWRDEPPTELVQETAFHWQQNFPPQKSVLISHQYQPVAGGQNLSPYEWHKLKETAFKELFCLEEKSAKGIEAYLGDKAFYPTRQVRYRLTTGGNWKGGIGQFVLRVRGGEGFPVAILCDPVSGDGLAGRELEVRAEDFSPQRDLDILFIGRRGGY